MDLKLDPEAVLSIATAAIVDQLPQESRDNVIHQAVSSLLEPSKQGYGFGKSPLQNAFDQAIAQAAHKVVMDLVANDETVKERFMELLNPLLRPALEEEAAKFESGLADTIGRAVGTWLSEQARASRSVD